MASIRVMGFMYLLLLFNPVAATVEYGFIKPTPTSVGLFGIQPMAPRPTRPPSMDEINGELRKRRLPDSIYSAIPDSWCAFIDGDFDYPFTCVSSSSQTCVVISSYIYTSIACSPYGIDRDRTTSIIISCLDSTKWRSLSTLTSSDTAACSLSERPYCQTATMKSGEYFLYCGSATQRSTISLESLNDWFTTGIIPSGFLPVSITTTPRSGITTTSLTSDTKTAVAPSSGGGLAAPAIAGIGVAVGAVVVGAIAALVICLFLRKRKRKEGANQPEEVSTGPNNPPMQQGNLGQGWQTGAPVSSSYPNSQTAFLNSPEQPSPPYSSEPASLYKPHSSSISSPVTPYDSNGRTGSTGQYPLSQNPSAIASPNNTIPPAFMLPVHNPGELPRFSNSTDHTAQPPSPISAIGHHGGGASLGNPIENQPHEMPSGFILHNNPRGSVTSQSPPYHDVSSSVASPTRGNSGNQSPPPLHPIHEAPQAYDDENQAHGMVPSPTSRQGGPGAYYEGTYPPQEFPAGGGGGGRHSHSNSVSSIPPPHDMSPPTPATPSIVAPTPRNNSGTYEGQQQAQYDIHEAPTTSYTAYSPRSSAATRGPLEVYHNHNAQ